MNNYFIHLLPLINYSIIHYLSTIYVVWFWPAVDTLLLDACRGPFGPRFDSFVLMMLAPWCASLPTASSFVAGLTILEYSVDCLVFLIISSHFLCLWLAVLLLLSGSDFLDSYLTVWRLPNFWNDRFDGVFAFVWLTLSVVRIFWFGTHFLIGTDAVVALWRAGTSLVGVHHYCCRWNCNFCDSYGFFVENTHVINLSGVSSFLAGPMVLSRTSALSHIVPPVSWFRSTFFALVARSFSPRLDVLDSRMISMCWFRRRMVVIWSICFAFFSFYGNYSLFEHSSPFRIILHALWWSFSLLTPSSATFLFEPPDSVVR